MDDFHISFLKDLMNCPMTWEEIKAKYPNNHETIWTEVRVKHLLVQGTDEKYYLSFEARFKLLEYEELSEARKSSKKAQRHSTIAIMCAVIAIVVSIVLGILQLNFNKNQNIKNDLSMKECFNKIDQMNIITTNNGNELNRNLTATNSKLQSIDNRLESFETKLKNKKVIGNKK